MLPLGLEVGVEVGLADGDGLELGVGFGEGDPLGDGIGEAEAEGDGAGIGGNAPTRIPIRYDAPPTIVTSEFGPR
jgi:hypothetical protein